MKQTGGWLWRLSLVNLLFLYGPIAVLILFSFNASRLSATWQGWSLQWYSALWANQGRICPSRAASPAAGLAMGGCTRRPAVTAVQY